MRLSVNPVHSELQPIAYETLKLPHEGHRVRIEAVQTGYEAGKSSSRSDGLNVAVGLNPRKG